MKKLALSLSLAFLTVFVSIPAEAQKPHKRPPPPIEVAKVIKKEFSEKLLLFGNIEAGSSATVRAEIQGTVISFPKEVGDALPAGKVVTRIDPENYRIELDIAKSSLHRTEASLELAKLIEGRIGKLYEKEVVSLEELQESRLNSRMKEAEVAQKRAELKRAERDLRLTSVRAPYGGRLSAKHIQKGDFVRSGDPLFGIVSLAAVHANVVLPETSLGFVKIKSKANIRLDAYPDTIFEGTVTRIAPKASVKSRDFVIRVDFKDKKEIARDGMFVRVEIVPKQKTVLMIPKDAIVERGQRKIVFKISDGKAQKVNITALRQKGAMVEIEGDLKEGDEIAVTGNEILRDGAAVNVTLRR